MILQDYATQSAVNSAIAVLPTTIEVSAQISAALLPYATQSSLQTLIAGLVTATNLDILLLHCLKQISKMDALPHPFHSPAVGLERMV